MATIGKVEIVVTSDKDPNEIARLVLGELQSPNRRLLANKCRNPQFEHSETTTHVTSSDSANISGLSATRTKKSLHPQARHPSGNRSAIRFLIAILLRSSRLIDRMIVWLEGRGQVRGES